MVNILIVDDHKAIRDAFKRILSDESDIRVAFEAESAEIALELLSKEKVDMVVMDIKLGGMNGLQAMKIIKKLQPTLPVLMVSALSGKIYADKSLKAGASGFVSKENAFEELVTAIRKIALGGIYISPLMNGLMHQ